MVHNSLAAAQAMKDCWLCFHAVTRKNDSMSNFDSFHQRILGVKIIFPRDGKPRCKESKQKIKPSMSSFRGHAGRKLFLCNQRGIKTWMDKDRKRQGQRQKHRDNFYNN